MGDAEDRSYLIRKGGAYYRPNERGYTGSAILAGRYTLDEAEKITHPNGPDGPRDGMSYVHESVVPDEDWQVFSDLRDSLAKRDATISRLMEQVNTLTTEKHADAEAIGAIEAKLAEVTAERDRLQAAGTFAQGIEAAADFVDGPDTSFMSKHMMAGAIRALSPTPQADAMPAWMTHCIQCNRWVDTREADKGGDVHGAKMEDGWVCSSECWSAAIGEPQADPVREAETAAWAMWKAEAAEGTPKSIYDARTIDAFRSGLNPDDRERWLRKGRAVVAALAKKGE